MSSTPAGREQEERSGMRVRLVLCPESFDDLC